MIKRSLLLSLLLVAGSLQAQVQTPDLAKAKQTAETICAGCHMADGNSQLPANPKLAGQHPITSTSSCTTSRAGTATSRLATMP